MRLKNISLKAVDLLRGTARGLSARAIALFRRATPIAYHTVLVTLSAAIALSLPLLVSSLSQHFFVYWAEIEHEMAFLVAVEIAVALLLISLFNFVGKSLKDTRLAAMAREAGLVYFFPSKGGFRKRKSKKLKKSHGLARSIMVIGSTGYRTFVDEKGELRSALEGCLEAKILLVNPYSPGARIRATAISHPGTTVEGFQGQIRKSIAFLKHLRTAQKNIKLKLYSDPPHVKLAILGDYIWIQHYHTRLDVQTMPEYVFRHNQSDHGLYALFYQYFMKRWESPDIPEYDLENDELVFKSHDGGTVRREKFAVTSWGEPPTPAGHFEEHVRKTAPDANGRIGGTVRNAGIGPQIHPEHEPGV